MGTMVNKPVWMADDGESFDSQEEMQAYEGMMHNRERIDAYLNSVDWTAANKGDVRGERAAASARTRAENVIAAFLGFEAAQHGTDTLASDEPATEQDSPPETTSKRSKRNGGEAQAQA